MKRIRVLLLCAGVFFTTGLYAQEIKEIQVAKPGKLEKLIKKEKQPFDKLKLTGTVNCEDWTALNSIVENLHYLDLRETSFVPNDRHADKYCDNYRRENTLLIPWDLSGLNDFYVPNDWFSKIEFKAFSHIKKLHMPFGVSISGDISVDTLFVTGLPTREGFQYKKIIELTGWDSSTDPILLSNTLDRASKDPIYAKWAKYMRWEITKFGPINADVLIIQKKESADMLDFSSCPARIVFVEENKWTHLNRYRKDQPITTEYLRKVDSFGDDLHVGGRDVFPDDKKVLPDTIILSNRVDSLPPGLFGGHSAKHVVLNDGIKAISGYALPRLRRIKIPSSVVHFSPQKQIDTIELDYKTPPKWLKEYPKEERANSVFLIPNGSFKDYFEFDSETYFVEKGEGGSYTINVPKGNTLLSYISLTDLMTADSLTITGVLFEQDFSFIRMARKLKYLDISKCFTTYSTAFLNKLEQEDRALAKVFNIISEGLDIQYQEKQIGSLDHAVGKVIADAISEAYSKGYSDEKMCLIPVQAFHQMESLVCVKMPILAVGIGAQAFRGCTKLETIEFPPFLRYIGDEAFAYCHRLKDFELPKTLTEIEKKAFFNCNELTRFVFPEVSRFESFSYGEHILDNCCNLQEIVYPEGMTKIPSTGKECYNLRKVIIPSTATEINIENRNWGDSKAVPCEFHIKATTPPKIYKKGYDVGDHWGDNATLYIPRGTITSYMAAYGIEHKYIEE